MGRYDRQGKDIDTPEPKRYTSHNWNQSTGGGFVSNWGRPKLGA